MPEDIIPIDESKTEKDIVLKKVITIREEFGSHYNPTDLPDIAIDMLCKITDDCVRTVNGQYHLNLSTFTILDLQAYHNFLWRDCNLCPPDLDAIFLAAKDGRLKGFLKESIDPNLKYDISLRKNDNFIRSKMPFTFRTITYKKCQPPTIDNN